jgi:hypothetical protein
MNVAFIQPSRVPEIWPLVLPMLRPAVEVQMATFNADDVLRNLCLGAQHLFVVHDADRLRAAIVVEVYSRPRARMCGVPYLGGDGMADWWDAAEAEIEKFARAQGCTRFEAMVRPGLARMLKGRFANCGTVIRRDI